MTQAELDRLELGERVRQEIEWTGIFEALGGPEANIQFLLDGNGLEVFGI